MNKIFSYRWLARALLGALIYSLALNSLAFTKGADISWITEMESAGSRFYDSNGTEKDVIQILKGKGMDAVRLRVWVNPANGWNNMDDTINKARRAKAAGMRIMIDFHYSDSWADPGQQTKPAAWKNYSFEQLMAAVYQHTQNSLLLLQSAGITPEWVQVGNETNNGMLWEEGRASANMRNFAWLVNSGYDATKAVFPNAKVIVHIANCFDNGLFRWIFDGLNNNGGKWDIIGASNYPTVAPNRTWQQANSQCLSNLNDMVSRYQRDVMIAEIGVPWDHAQGKDIIADMISKMRQVSGGRGQGVFYWEPQAYNWQGYGLGAWNPNTRRPAASLDAFLEGALPSKTILVRALGKAGKESLSLRINGTNIATWTLSTSMQSYSVKTTASGPLTVNFTNDQGNYDVQVDYIQVDGTTYQAEAQSINTGVWQNNACGGGSGKSEWLHCNGYIGFGNF